MKKLIAIAIAALLATAQAHAGWEVHKHTDAMDGDSLFAVSPEVEFEQGNKAQLKYVCQHLNFEGFYQWVELNFLNIPPMNGEGDIGRKMLYVQAAFAPEDRRLKDVRFYQEYDEGLYYDVDNDPKLEQMVKFMATNDSVLIEYPFIRKEQKTIKYSLTGSKDAINQVRNFCEKPRIDG